jgi:cell division protein FtsI (penicillin-binding protein 3)
MELPPLPPLTKTQERAVILGLILLGWAFVVTARLFGLQILGHDDFVRLARRQQEAYRPIGAPRGSIFDRNGNVLAISSNSHQVIVNPRRIPNKSFAAALLARILGLDGSALQKELERVVQSKIRGYFVVDDQVTDEQVAALKGMDLDWLEIHEGSVRTYPNGTVAAHVIGNVDGRGKGVAGIEAKLNKELSGTPGSLRIERDGKAVSYESEVVKTANMGKNIGLTIDRELGYIAQEALKTAVVKNHGDHGSLVVMDPRTGEILALENYPTYDPNAHLVPGEKPVGREDLAVVAPFEPGSVFKIVTLSAALETTNLTPLSVINCGGGVLRMFGRVIHDTHSNGALSMEDVLARSSNIGAIRIGMQVGNEKLYEYIRRLGFGTRTGIELPAEAPGLVRPLKKWQPTSIGSVPMGHEISVTSLQLAQLGSVIANGGFMVHPHVVAWEQTPGGPKLEVDRPDPVRVLQSDTVMIMRRMMRRVVSEPFGTGHRLHVVGYTIAGKTGTAQIFDYAHHTYTHRYNASFLGYGPAQNPAVVVVVTVSGTTGVAGFGSEASGPAFTRVMSAALGRLGVMRDVPEEIEELIAKQKSNSRDKGKPQETDSDEVAGLSDPLTPGELKDASGGDAAVPVEDTWVDPNAPKAPNFVGKTVKDVIAEAAAEGIEIDMLGEGLAKTQVPLPGASLIPGERVRVRFAR